MNFQSLVSGWYFYLLKRIDNDGTCDRKCGSRHLSFVSTSANIEQMEGTICSQDNVLHEAITKFSIETVGRGRCTEHLFFKLCTNFWTIL